MQGNGPARPLGPMARLERWAMACQGLGAMDDAPGRRARETPWANGSSKSGLEKMSFPNCAAPIPIETFSTGSAAYRAINCSSPRLPSAKSSPKLPGNRTLPKLMRSRNGWTGFCPHLAYCRLTPAREWRLPSGTDAMIAAVAIVNWLEVVTRNVRDFEQLGVPALDERFRSYTETQIDGLPPGPAIVTDRPAAGRVVELGRPNRKRRFSYALRRK